MSTHRRADRGAILPITLIVVVVLGAIVLAMANYASATLSYGQVSEARANRLAAAQAAMDDAIERLELKRSLCSTTAGAAAQPINLDFPAINGAQALVTCQIIGGEVPPADGWAIVVTGEGLTGPGLQTNAGGRPKIEGPVYVFNHNTVSLSKKTTMVKGDLWHEDDACSGGSPTGGDVAFKRSNVAISNLVFDPTTRGTYCTNRSWKELFAVAPPTSHVSAIPLALPPVEDGPAGGKCKLFYPGRYTTAPVLADNNYFRSGDYVFDNVGVLRVKGQHVTFGNIPASDDFAYPLLEENDTATTCLGERQADPNKTGATVYLGGNSRILAEANAGFEVSRRQQGQYWVSLQALDSVPKGTLLIESDPGGTKDIALNGLVYAPYSHVSFGTVSAKKDAAIRGGAVVASFEGTISQAGDGFLIKVPTSDQSIKVLLESTATDSRSSTSVSVIADWRPTTGALAVNSWRVAN